MFAYYMAFATLESLCDSTGKATLEYLEYAKTILNWFDDMRNPVPTWYLKEYTV